MTGPGRHAYPDPKEARKECKPSALLLAKNLFFLPHGGVPVVWPQVEAAKVHARQAALRWVVLAALGRPAHACSRRGFHDMHADCYALHATPELLERTTHH